MSRLVSIYFIPLLALILSGCAGIHLRQDPPGIPPAAADSIGNDWNGGRVQAIAVSPMDRNRALVAMEFGGLWGTINGGGNWFRIFTLPAAMVADVEFGSDGNTVIATVMRDNQVANGGGIYVSHDRGGTWLRPVSGAVPPLPFNARTSAYGISKAPDQSRTWYVATDFGVAVSTDDGDSWVHRQLASPTPRMAHTILAFSRRRVLAMLSDGIYRSDDGGASWQNVIPDSFGQWSPYNVNAMDRSPDNDWAFIQREYHYGADPADRFGTLWFYELDSGAKILLTTPQGTSRGPFIRVTREKGPEFGPRPISIWTGHGWDGYRVTRTTAAEFRALTKADWNSYIATSGVHSDMSDMAVDSAFRPVFLGSDGGIFKPRPASSTAIGDWMSAAVPGSGMNSLQMTDLAGTNIRRPDGAMLSTSLYFGTQDNFLWASPDGGKTWPKNDGGEGYDLEVRQDARPGERVTVGYVEIGGNWSEQFADANFLNQRLVPNVDQAGQPLETYVNAEGQPRDTMKQAFYLEPSAGGTETSWLRLRIGGAPTNEIYVSRNSGNNWRRRFTLNFPWAGAIQRTNIEGGPVVALRAAAETGIGDVRIPLGMMAWVAVYSPGRIGLIPLSNLYADRVDTLDDSDVVLLPGAGSLGLRGAQWDFHAVFGADPFDWRFLIAPDVVAGDVKISRDGGQSWATSHRLTAQVLKGGRLKMYDVDAYHMQVTKIAFDPYRKGRILVGTRDAGVICSIDWGKTWRTITNSDRIGYVTGFHFYPNGAAHIGSWGHGLWFLERTSGCSKTDYPYWLPRFPPEGTADTDGVLARQAAVPPQPRGIAQPGLAKLFLSSSYPASGLAGVGRDHILQVAGRNLSPGAEIVLLIQLARPLKHSVKVDRDGTFMTAVKLPDDLPVGQYRIEAVDGSSGRTLVAADFQKNVAADEVDDRERGERKHE